MRLHSAYHAGSLPIMRSKLPTWREMHPDDDPKMEEFRFERLRRATPAEKLRMMEDLNMTARRLALMGLRMRNPGATEAELRRMLADLLLGPELAERAYGPHARRTALQPATTAPAVEERDL